MVRENSLPAALTYTAGGGEIVRRAARSAAAAIGLVWSESNALVLRRGPYVIAAGLDESTRDCPSFATRPCPRQASVIPGRRSDWRWRAARVGRGMSSARRKLRRKYTSL